MVTLYCGFVCSSLFLPHLRLFSITIFDLNLEGHNDILVCALIPASVANCHKSVMGVFRMREKSSLIFFFIIEQQFMLGNYSFVIKALDPQDNTVKEGFKFSKPITIAMFYDVDNLVKANSKHVNNEVTKEDIDPVLYLWDSKNDSW